MTIYAGVEGFEGGHYTQWDTSVRSNVAAIAGAARSGDYGLRVNPTAASPTDVEYQFTPVCTYYLVSRVYFRLNSLPTSDQSFGMLRSSSSTDCYAFNFRDSDNAFTISCIVGGVLQETQVGPVLVAGDWYRLEFRSRGGSAGSEQLEWQVDGTSYTTIGPNAAYPTPNFLRFGNSASSTFSADFDDIVWVYNDDTAQSAEIQAVYPFGTGTVKRLAPIGVGTHANSGSFSPSTGTIADSWQLLDDRPTATLTTYVAQTVLGGSDYLEYTFDSLTTGGEPQVVSMKFNVRSSSLSSNNGGVHAVDGANDNEIYDSVWLDTSSPYTHPTFDAIPLAGTGTDQYDAAAPWTRARVNAMLGRFGYSGDVIGEPWLVALWLEVALGPTPTSLDILSTVATLDHDVIIGQEPDQHHLEVHDLGGALHNAGFFLKSADGATITDDDFAVPANGMVALTYDTNTGISLLWTRANGSWTFVEVTV